MHNNGTPAPAPYPSPATGWFLVAMLTLAYLFSFVDRYILGLLIEPIKADLQLNDEQISWVLGPAFAIFYATMGLPLGWLADRARRTLIVSAGITVWSLATALSGLAGQFWHLFFARMTVGVGEAALSPAAFSMIGDSFPPERRGAPIAVYSAALTLGAGLASLIGGGVLLWAKTADVVEVPVVGPLAPWQVTFLAVGLPGVLLALVFLVMPEPARRPLAASDAQLKGNGLSDALAYAGARFGTFAGFVSLVCVMTIIAYSQGFMAATFQRTWGWPPETYAFANAAALLTIGPATVILSGALSDRWSRAGMADAPLRLLIAGFLIMVPSGAAAPLMPTGEMAFGLLCVNTVGIAMVSAVGVTTLLAITPAKIRGQMTALYYLAISLSGLMLGPTTVGMLSSRVFGEDDIRYAMAALPLLYGLVPALCLPWIRRLYVRELQRLGIAGSP